MPTPAASSPIAWPRSVGQIPINYARNLTQIPEAPDTRYWDGSSAPLYPFGYGLSYSTFTTGNLRIAQPSVHAGATLNVSIDVQNTSARAGDEVVQLYTHQRSGSASRPVRELKGFYPRLAPSRTRRAPSPSRSTPKTSASGAPKPTTGPWSPAPSTSGLASTRPPPTTPPSSFSPDPTYFARSPTRVEYSDVRARINSVLWSSPPKIRSIGRSGVSIVRSNLPSGA